jgi:hypothetical protein
VHPVRVFFVINGVQIKDARDDCAGNVARNERIQLGPRMPAIDAAAQGRGDQGAGAVLEESGVCERCGWRVLASGSAQVRESAERTVIFSMSEVVLDVERSVHFVG